MKVGYSRTLKPFTRFQPSAEDRARILKPYRRVSEKLHDAVRACPEQHLQFWENDTYVVIWRNFPSDDPSSGLIVLSIKRIDQQPIHDWGDLQQVKNMLVGVENEAVELYPAESRLVDTANHYFLWVSPDPNYRWPFGFTERSVMEHSAGGAVQRKFDTGGQP